MKRVWRVYLASSWRNDMQPIAVRTLRAVGFEVYDFRNPAVGDDGFHWSEIDGGWRNWDHDAFVKALGHPIARRGFMSDMAALMRSDAVVLLLPCGRSAHLEAGWATGAGKPLYIVTAGAKFEPELMYLMASGIFEGTHELIAALQEPIARAAGGTVQP